MRKLNIRASVRTLTAAALATALGSVGGLATSVTSAQNADADPGTTNYVFQDDIGAVSVVGGSEHNDITVTLSSGTYTITDTAHALKTWPPCQSLTSNTVTCK